MVNQSEFFRVRVGSIPPEIPLTFELFILLDGKFHPYVHPGDPLPKPRWEQLIQKDTGHFYVLNSDRWKYREFMRGNIADSNLNRREKALLLRESALSFVEDIFENPDLQMTLTESRSLVNDFIQLMEHDPQLLGGVLALSSHDFYTFNHSLDVAIYSLAIGKAAQLAAEQLQELGVGALFHDVGKRLVPVEILCKPGGLSPEEWEIMQEHPRYGLELLNEIPQISEGIIAACLEHHESWSGTGYPRKLKGDQIHLFGRIVAIADTFDAMTTQRSYNSPMSPKAAVTTMSEQLRGRYDPNLLKIMTEALVLLDQQM